MLCYKCRGIKGKKCENCGGYGVVDDESNVTKFSMKEIKGFKLLKNFRNEWRRRNVYVYEHPDDVSVVITVGYPFNGGGATICEELKEVYFPQQGV